MSREIINPFTDIPEKPIEASNFWGSDVMENAKSMAIGAGNKAWKVDGSGMWLGADKFINAPFRVDMAGNVWASNITLSQYIASGGAAADINSHTTTVNGSKLTAGTVIADYVVANISISSPSIIGGSLTGSTLTIGGGTTQFRANSSGLLLGDPANPSFFVNMSGVLFAKSVNVDGTIIARSASIYNGQPIDQQYIGNLSANKITTGTLNAALINVINLSASSLSSGTINGSVINVTNLNASNITTGNLNVSRLNGGAISLGAGQQIAGSLNLYTTSSNFNGNITWYRNGSYYCHIQPDEGGTFLNIDRTLNVNGLRVGASYMRFNNTTFEVNEDSRFYKSINVYNTTSLYLDGSTPKVSIGGYTKNAILKTSKGYRALYCVESPEVSFMDWCQREKISPFWQFWKKEYRYIIDPLFREVTAPPYHFIPTAQKDIFQVWGKRVHHTHRRFEKKTREEFLKNERFLGMAKVNKKHYN